MTRTLDRKESKKQQGWLQLRNQISKMDFSFDMESLPQLCSETASETLSIIKTQDFNVDKIDVH